MKVMLPAKMLVWSFLLAVMAVNGDGKVLRDSLETKLFKASITCLSSYQTTDDVECEFSLENKADCAYSVLKWNTPLNDEEPEGLVVTRDGKTLNYEGVMMKRETPGPEAFTTIGAGETITSKFNLSPPRYDTSKPGAYTVAVNAYLEYEGEEECSPSSKIMLAHISSQAASFKVEGKK